MNIEARRAEIYEIIAATQDEIALDEVALYLKQRLKPLISSYTKEEAELIDKIKNGLSKGVLARYEELSLKLLRREITEVERQELLEINAETEQFAADRIYYMIDLAKIWNTTVDDVMKRLNIHPPEPLSA